MKICTASSARGYTCQINRIEKGFEKLGHEITPHVHEADLTYVNNPWFEQVIKDYQECSNKSKLILNVLDIPEHLFPRFDLRKLTTQLSQASAVTTISEFVQSQVKGWVRLPSSVIYQPIMDVKKEEVVRTKPWRYLFIGRALDENKRTNIGLRALQIVGAANSEVVYVGTEFPGFGDNQAVINEDNLSKVYNSVDFVFCLGKIEGISLPIVEAMACGAIPIVINDLTTRQELLPSEVFPEYDQVAPYPLHVSDFIKKFLNNPEAMIEMKSRLYNFYLEKLQSKFSNEGVASAILKTYESLK